MQTGSDFESKNDAEVMWTDYLTISSNAAATSYKAVGTAGNEIKCVYVKNTDGTLGDKLTQGSAVGDGVFTYDPGTKALAFKSGDYADGTEIAVYYTRKLKADVLVNKSDTYSAKCKLYINAFAEDGCNNVYRVQIYIPHANFNGNFDLEFGENQAVHAFEAESLAGRCGLGGALWTYTVFGANEADYVAG